MIKIKLNDLPQKNGIVKEILVSQGSYVKSYQTVLIIDCDGDDVLVNTLFDGYIQKIYVSVGDVVNKGANVIKLNITVDEETFAIDEFNESDLFLDWQDNDESNTKTKLSKVKSKKNAKTASVVANDQVNSIVNEMQEKNEAGVSKFQERILNRLAAVTSTNDDSKLQKSQLTSSAINSEGTKEAKPLTFREIIMKRMHQIQAETKGAEDVKQNDNIATKTWNTPKEPEATFQKVGLIFDDKIDVNTDLKTVNEMISQSSYDKKNFSENLGVSPKLETLINDIAPSPLKNEIANQQESLQDNSFQVDKLETLAQQNLLTPNIETMAIDSQKSTSLIEGLEVRQSLSTARNLAVDAMKNSNRHAVHLSLNCEVDMTEIIKLREKILSQQPTFPCFTYMVFIMKAISLALEEYPKLNASYDPYSNELLVKRYHNIGVALQTNNGLQVPVIRLVDKLTIQQLANDVEQSTQRIKANRAHDYDFVGSTITVTNFGTVGAVSGISPIFYPNVAVIVIGKIIKKPVVVGKNVIVRNIMNISLSIDQRAIDSVEAGEFLERLKSHLEQPYILSLGLF